VIRCGLLERECLNTFVKSRVFRDMQGSSLILFDWFRHTKLNVIHVGKVAYRNWHQYSSRHEYDSLFYHLSFHYLFIFSFYDDIDIFHKVCIWLNAMLQTRVFIVLVFATCFNFLHTNATFALLTTLYTCIICTSKIGRLCYMLTFCQVYFPCWSFCSCCTVIVFAMWLWPCHRVLQYRPLFCINWESHC